MLCIFCDEMRRDDQTVSVTILAEADHLYRYKVLGILAQVNDRFAIYGRKGTSSFDSGKCLKYVTCANCPFSPKHCLM